MAEKLGGRQVVFTDQREVKLQDFRLDNTLGRQEALVRGRFSVISPGTEGAGYTGLVGEMPTMREMHVPGKNQLQIYPRTTGYGYLGEILSVGSDVEGLRVGDTVATFSKHASVAMVNVRHFCLPIPPGLGLADERAVFVRMAGVAISALRTSSVSAGDKVLVIGLGLVGNFAAQLFQLAGADVLASEMIDERRAIAADCGILHSVNPRSDNLTEAVLDWTGGKGADVTVEAIGHSDLIADAVELTRRHGELILLGSPRRQHTLNITPMLARIHLMGVTVKGALEWLHPISDTPGLKHSMIRNYQQLLEWMSVGRLVIDPLRTHVLPPERCAEAYAGLLEKQDRYLGVVFDWTATV